MRALLICTIVALAAFPAWAQEVAAPVAPFQKATIEQTEASLIQALESDSPSLRATAALTIRQLKVMMPERSFSCFVIPLMRVVKDENSGGCSRVVAAIALHELHSAVGDYAIAGVARFTDCPKMKRTCEWLAYYQILEDHPDLAMKAEDVTQVAMSLAGQP